MKALLKLLNTHVTLGENLFKTKTLTKWLSELSQKFHFLLSSWQPAYSYGQTQTSQQALLNIQSLSSSQPKSSVSLAPQLGQNALKKKLKKRSKQFAYESSVSRLKGLAESINIEAIKVRLFNGLYTFWDNKRLRWGMLFLLIIAPASKFAFLLFPEAGFGEYLINLGPVQIINTIEGIDNWYYVFFYHYFFSIGELLAPVLSIFGIFLLFPKKYYPSYLIGVPFGYYLSMLVHRMFFVSSNVDFISGFTNTMTVSFLIMGIVFFIVSDKVLFKQNHQKRAAEARIIGLVNMPGMSWGDKEEIIRKEVKEVMKVDNELFIKESA